jgi:hypothetical protein
MSRSANAGDLRTSVRFVRVDREKDVDGVSNESEKNIFGEGCYVPCKWVSAHGAEVFRAMELQMRDPATITLRWSPLFDARMRVYKLGDSSPFEVISVNNVEDRGVWCEMKLRRYEPAR